MSGSLFNIDEPDSAPVPAQQEVLIRDEQVKQIRGEFERLSLTSQEERKSVIEAASLREVASLRELTAVEARRIITRLRDRKPEPASKPSGSSWDTRDEDTWIDKL